MAPFTYASQPPRVRSKCGLGAPSDSRGGAMGPNRSVDAATRPAINRSRSGRDNLATPRLVTLMIRIPAAILPSLIPVRPGTTFAALARATRLSSHLARPASSTSDRVFSSASDTRRSH